MCLCVSIDVCLCVCVHVYVCVYMRALCMTVMEIGKVVGKLLGCERGREHWLTVGDVALCDRDVYKCSRYTAWGDRFPITFPTEGGEWRSSQKTVCSVWWNGWQVVGDWWKLLLWHWVGFCSCCFQDASLMPFGEFRSSYLVNTSHLCHGENSGHLTWVCLQQLQEECYPSLPVCAVCFCVQTLVRLPVFGIFNMHTDADACVCTWGLYEHCKRVCTDSWLGGKNPLRLQRIEPISLLCHVFWSDTLSAELSIPSSLLLVWTLVRTIT